jgi:hypothetical protein
MDVVAVNRHAKIALADDDALMPFDSMIDEFGERTEDPDEAVTVICQHPNGEWWCIDLTCFESTVAH